MDQSSSTAYTSEPAAMYAARTASATLSGKSKASSINVSLKMGTTTVAAVAVAIVSGLVADAISIVEPRKLGSGAIRARFRLKMAKEYALLMMRTVFYVEKMINMLNH